ncbi:MAG: AmmeMemoRadiSam system protein A [Acidobacteria bacterium]|nr:AmmeMemoRadiSam system protein A [Acidobacteriota bacterium]
MTTPLTAQERRSLLDVARQAIADQLAGRPQASASSDGVFERRCGVFVSLHHDGELRGCIGYPDGAQPLGIAVPRCAVSAATGDPRFAAVTAAELPEIDIEISVLTPVEPVTSPADIEVGRDGLIVEQHWHRGLLLPQVATEWGWDRDTFLAQTCVKAGLPREAWKRGASIFRFQAEVFGDR